MTKNNTVEIFNGDSNVYIFTYGLNIEPNPNPIIGISGSYQIKIKIKTLSDVTIYGTLMARKLWRKICLGCPQKVPSYVSNLANSENQNDTLFGQLSR